MFEKILPRFKCQCLISLHLIQIAKIQNFCNPDFSPYILCSSGIFDSWQIFNNSLSFCCLKSFWFLVKIRRSFDFTECRSVLSERRFGMLQRVRLLQGSVFVEL